MTRIRSFFLAAFVVAALLLAARAEAKCGYMAVLYIELVSVSAEGGPGSDRWLYSHEIVLSNENAAWGLPNGLSSDLRWVLVEEAR